MDWFRCVVGEHEPVEPVMDVLEAIRHTSLAKGEKVKRWRFQGFEGWATPHVRYGRQGWRVLWETSGTAAPGMWGRLASFGGRSTRVDVQTTLRFSQPQPDFGRRCMSPLARRSSLLPQSRRHYGSASDSTGFWLGTVGRRTSETYIRLYDKGVQARTHPAGELWRLELEAKGQLAEGLRRELCDSLSVAELCYQRAVCSWKSAGCSWPVPGRAPKLGSVQRPPAPPSSSERLGIWLSNSVRPVVERMLVSFTTQELLELLGLQLVAKPIRDDECPF